MTDTPTRVGARLLSAVPNVLVLALLGAVLWWGHAHDWKLPKFSQLTGETEKAPDDWCAAHAVPESECVECQPKLMPRNQSATWCKIHGVHECPFELPAIAQLKEPPTIAPALLDRAQRALEFKERTPNTSKCKLHQRRIQFVNEAAVRKAGIEVDVVATGKIGESASANGEIAYDQTLVANLSSPVVGRVWHVTRQLGQAVKKGDVLALVDAAEVGKLKAELISAASTVALRSQRVENMKPLVGNIVREPEFLEAQSALREAQARLITAEQALGNLGLPVRAESLRNLEPEEMNRRLLHLGLPAEIEAPKTANLLPLRAPLDGVIVTRKIVEGEQVDATRTLFVIADTRRMWLTLNVRQEDARFIKPAGQEVMFRSEALSEEIRGEVVWVSSAVDEKTRTVQVRANLPNRDGQLRANVFGAGRIILRAEDEAILVPSEAVQWEGDCHVVFVRDKNYRDKGARKVFHTRSVRVGAKDEANTEIIAGVLPGEIVATKGAGLLRSELLKNNLGAG